MESYNLRIKESAAKELESVGTKHSIFRSLQMPNVYLLPTYCAFTNSQRSNRLEFCKPETFVFTLKVVRLLSSKWVTGFPELARLRLITTSESSF